MICTRTVCCDQCERESALVEDLLAV